MRPCVLVIHYGHKQVRIEDKHSTFRSIVPARAATTGVTEPERKRNNENRKIDDLITEDTLFRAPGPAGVFMRQDLQEVVHGCANSISSFVFSCSFTYETDAIFSVEFRIHPS